MRGRLWLLCVAAVELMLTAGAARADVTIDFKMDGAAHQVLIAQHMMRSVGGDAEAIFRGDRKVLWMLQPKDMKYVEMTEEDVRRLGATIDGAMKEMQGMLASLPPEQRAQVEAAMKNAQAGGEAAGKRTVEALGQSREINGFACKGYRVNQEKGAEMEVWATDPAAIEIKAGDLAVFGEMAEFMKAMTGNLESLRPFIKDFDKPVEGEVPGMPILVITRGSDGKEAGRLEVTGLKRGPIDAAQFEVPKGYKKESME